MDALDRTLAVFDRADAPTTPRTASEVADELDCARRTAYNRLERLADRGDLETKKVGARGRVWWRPLDALGVADGPGDGTGALADGTTDVDPDRDWMHTERDLLYATSYSIAAAETFEDGLHEVLREVCKATYWEFGEAWVPADDVLERASADYAGTADLEPLAELSETFTFERGEGLPGRVWASGDPEWMDDVTDYSVADAPRVRHAERFGVGAALGVPIATDEVVAVLVFTTRASRPADDRMIQLLSSVGTELGELVERQRAATALAREKALTERILSASQTGIAVFADGLEVVRANESAADLLGISPEDAPGYDSTRLSVYGADGDPLPFEERPVRRVFETGEPAERRVRIETADGDARWVSVTAAPLDDGGDVERVVATGADVTRIEEQARRLERQRADLRGELEDVFERIDDAFFALDDRWRFTYVNDRAESLLDVEATDLLGRRFDDALDPSDRARAAMERALRTQESTAFEEPYDARDAWFEVSVYPSETGLSVYFRDVTDRRRFERTLTALHETTRELVSAETRADASATLVEAASEVLGLPGVVVYRHDPDVDRLVPDAESVETEFMRGEFPPVPVGDDSITGGVFAAGEPVHVDDVRDDDRIAVDADGTEMRAGSFVPMGDHGILVAGSCEVGRFDRRTRRLVELLAANAEAAYDRIDRERRLDRQRERLAALDELNGVVRDSIDALVRQSTREEVERVVCERLADAESYEFAWIGEVDPHAETVELRTEAGVEGYLDDVAISVDPDDERSAGPTGRAVLTERMQISRNVTEGWDREEWREHAREHGFRSSASIPIVHEDTLYGVLNVYTARPDAFAGEEREVVGQLGEVVGHAIASVERKRALMNDEVVELELRIADVFEAVDAPPTDGTISFDHSVPLGDGAFLEYGTATGDAMATVESLTGSLDHWEDVTVVDEEFGTTTFELRLSEPPVVSAIASNGGYVERAVVENGDYHMVLQFPPGAEVRSVVERVRETYPTVEIVTRRQVDRSNRRFRRLDRALAETLTDRQRAALDAAYFSGYFEWPRESSAQQVADSLDVSDATFHEHVRIAEQKLLSALFERSAAGVE